MASEKLFPHDKKCSNTLFCYLKRHVVLIHTAYTSFGCRNMNALSSYNAIHFFELEPWKQKWKWVYWIFNYSFMRIPLWKLQMKMTYTKHVPYNILFSENHIYMHWLMQVWNWSIVFPHSKVCCSKVISSSQDYLYKLFFNSKPIQCKSSCFITAQNIHSCQFFYSGHSFCYSPLANNP